MLQIKVNIWRERKFDYRSWLVEFFLGKKYSHISIEKDGLLYHMTLHGFRIDVKKDFESTHILVDEKTVNLTCSEDYFNGFIDGNEGRSYAYIQNVGMSIKWLARLFVNGRADMHCSEFVAWALARCADKKWKEEIDFLDPKEVFEAI